MCPCLPSCAAAAAAKMCSRLEKRFGKVSTPLFSQFWNHETLAQSPIISGTLVTEIIFQGLNLPLIALPVPPMPTSPLPVGEGLTEALREFWHKLVSHLPRIPGMPSLYLSSVFTLPSLTMPSMPAMFTLRIDHYTHMPSLPSLPSLPSIPLMDLPFSTLVIAILLASLLLAFVISAHLKEDKVNIPVYAAQFTTSTILFAGLEKD